MSTEVRACHRLVAALTVDLLVLSMLGRTSQELQPWDCLGHLFEDQTVAFCNVLASPDLAFLDNLSLYVRW